jgi:hypothetical protein
MVIPIVSAMTALIMASDSEGEKPIAEAETWVTESVT